MKLIFTSHNEGKAKEIEKLLPSNFQIQTLKEIEFFDEIEENQDTFKGNALQKANFIHEKFNVNCFSEDSGLEIEVLNGEPGVLSARYAGQPKDDEKNIQKVIQNIKNKENKKAAFKTVICLILNNKEYFFEGTIKGEIILEKRGNNGFGYDPIFIPNGYDKTFAEMDISEKNKISHRAIAIHKMVDFLKNSHSI